MVQEGDPPDQWIDGMYPTEQAEELLREEFGLSDRFDVFSSSKFVGMWLGVTFYKLRLSHALATDKPVLVSCELASGSERKLFPNFQTALDFLRREARMWQRNKT